MSIIAMNPKFSVRISSIPYFLFSSHTHESFLLHIIFFVAKKKIFLCASMEANEHGVGEHKLFCGISLRGLESFDW
jgi:hypothetical protein